MAESGVAADAAATAALPEDVHPPWCNDAVVAQQAAPQPTVDVAEPPPGGESVQAGGTTFNVPSHYKLQSWLGHGTYGSVAAFNDTIEDRSVAVKKIPNPFRNRIDGKRCLREIKLLRVLDHECIIKLLDVLSPPSPDFQEVYLVTELMDADLHMLITNSGQALSEDHVQFFTYNIFRALLYLHSANVVHRDLKPLNVLVNKNCDIKLCDFGLARGRAGFSQEDNDWLRTEYVGTRWYRAPEVVLTSMEYTAAVDIWGAGCILAELIGRLPLFKGRDFLDQIRSICEVLGTPSEDELAFIPPEHEAARTYVRTHFPALPRKQWAAVFPEASPAQHELLDRLLRFDPGSRLTAQQALQDPYLADYHDDEEELVAPAHVDWSFDDEEAEAAQLRHLVYEEAAAFHPEILERDREVLEARGLFPALGSPASS